MAAADDAHALHLHQGLDDVARVDAAHALDLGARDGLAPRDDGERLDGGAHIPVEFAEQEVGLGGIDLCADFFKLFSEL